MTNIVTTKIKENIMATKTCPNGHQYDSSIYGNNCPFCPSGEKTRVNIPENPTINVNDDDPEKKTVPYNDISDGGGHTVIRRVMPDGGAQAGAADNNYRKVIGLLVTYSGNPAGDIYNIYEGKNIVGSAPTDSVAIVGDKNMSRGHLTILKQPGGSKFWANDNMSSNGSYINGRLIEEKTELHSGDVIVLGATKFVFLAIPEF